MAARSRRAGSSVTEVVVVIAIVAVLAAMVAAGVLRVREAAARARCSDNVRQLGVALHQYHDANRSFPPGCSYQDGKDPCPHMGWPARLLPYVEREALWREALDAFATDSFFEHVPPHTGLAVVVPLFTCPSDGRTSSPWDFKKFKVAFTSYLGVEGTDQYAEDGLLFLDSQTRLADVTDGASTTLLVGERPPGSDRRLGWWYAGWGQSKDGSAEMLLGAREANVTRDCPSGPYHFQAGRLTELCDVFHFWSPHPGGAHFLFCDGSVRFLRYAADPLLPALATRAGGESPALPD